MGYGRTAPHAPVMIAVLLLCAAGTPARPEAALPGPSAAPAGRGGPSVDGYPSVQEAINANPGRMVYVPPGDYEIADKIRIQADNTGLFGPGRILQTNPEVPVIEVVGASGVQIRDLTLTRPAGKMDARAEAVLASRCRELVLDSLRVLDNRSAAGAIGLHECTDSEVRNCLVRNYMRISVDDRTRSDDWGYAFRCIDGTGIVVERCKATLIQGNRVVERNLLPTPEVEKEFGLGKFVKKNERKGTLVQQSTWDAEYVGNWHQGSGIIVTSPEVCDQTRILGNHIENAAQGIDIHADHVIVSQNTIDNAFIGMKAMHGSRNVVITGNLFSRNDLWAIGLMPGAASHAAGPAAEGAKPREANVDGGSIIANNIISDFGYGSAHWVWGDQGTPIRFDNRQKPENPPLTDVIIQGNVIYDTGRDGVLVDGAPKVAPPRYEFAVRVASEAKGLHFIGNIFHPGLRGVSNVELPP